MRAAMSEGLSAAEAARVVGGHEERRGAVARDEWIRELETALTAFDETRAHAVFDGLVGALSLESLLGDVVLPLLRRLGEGWERGEITVAQEHFSSNLLRGRLLGLGRGWGRRGGRHALLAAPPGEQHDLGLVVLGLALRDRGWRVTFLGADTPIETMADTGERVAPEVIVVAALLPLAVGPRGALRALARQRRVVVSGAGIGAELADDLGGEHFAGGPLEAAGHLSGTRAA
jgi:methanogenic corrinoid protein MtbC1